MQPITGTKLREFLNIAGDRLKGDWVIVGGSVLPLLGIEHRVTLDIDLASCDADSSQRTMITVMDIAQELGLPVEAINQAAAYFLEKIPDWRSHLVLVHQGKQAKFFRPNTRLFIQLKISRLSESDLADCLKILSKTTPEERAQPNYGPLLSAIKALAARSLDSDKKARYRDLQEALVSSMKKGRRK
jgi:hypothetical protein